jgi:hypothetical protein
MLGERSTGARPRRGIELPAPRRRLSPELLAARAASAMRAAGRPGPLPTGERTNTALRLPRHLYFEGGIVVVREGVEVARCDRLWISPLDDRMVLEGAELRYLSVDDRGREQTLVVRGPRLVREGRRYTGRDLSITACTAGEPHFDVLAGEAEILERDDQFEITSRGNWLRFASTRVMPLPDAHFFSGEQGEFPLKGAAAGYSSTEGVRARVELGMNWHRVGGSVHEFLTGRPASEFRGDWQLGLGYIEKRGAPVDATVGYRAAGLYEGTAEAFYLDDDGPNRREITANIDGSPIDDRNRHLLRTKNRVFLGTDTHVDLTAFHAGDAAVYSEFFGGDYRNTEVPETSVYLHHAAENKLVTVGGRFNLDEFSYADNRSLAPSFTEELPVATFHWISQPVAETPWGTPVVLDAATELGQRRSDYDDLFGSRVSDRTFRADQLIEISAPFHVGPISIRPYADVRGTFYDTTVDDGAEDRIAFEAGVRAATRFARTFGGDGDGAVRHVVSPVLTFADRFHVEHDPSRFHQFDAVDALTEQNLVRFEVRNLVQRMEQAPGGRQAVDFLFVDLAQDWWPDADRDNAGDELGLFYYDLLVRPNARWIPFRDFAMALYGDHDWDDGLRTLDAEVRFGPLLGLDWFAEYRTDAVVDGAVGLGASTRLYDRWELWGGGQYDLDRDDFLEYGGQLVRHDHDWSIAVGVSYDPYADDLSFRVEFTPRLASLYRNRDRTHFGSERFRGIGTATGY